MAHTPGPWGLGDITDGEGRPIPFEAVVYGGDDAETEIVIRGLQAKADARLIAAAPDLMSALNGIVKMYVRMINSGDCGFWDPETDAEVVAARAAIRKAEGQS